MVGVPGRSKACHTCRQRRIRCGLERPRCANCIKSNRFCTGYERSHTFVFSKEMEAVPAADHTRAPAASTEAAPSRTGQVTRWKTTQAAPGAEAEAGGSGGRPTLPGHEEDLVAERLRLTQHVSPMHADRDQSLSVFLHAYLPRVAQPGPSDPPTTRNFLLILPLMPNMAPALEYALLALCTAAVGAVRGQRDVACRGRDLYTKALGELQRAVLDPRTRLHDQTLAATLLLTMFEFTECPGKVVRGFDAHLSGAMNILQLRGAASHTTGFSHALLFGIRKLALFRSLYLSESSFLATQDWQSIPYGVVPKNANDELFDLLEAIPDLLARIKAVRTETRIPAILSQTLEATQLAWHIDKGLAAWAARFAASITGPLVVPKLARIASATDDPDQGKLYPVAFHFSHFIVGQAMALYWASLAILYSVLSNSYKQLGRIEHTATNLQGDMAPCTCTGRDGETAGLVVEKDTAAIMRKCVRHFKLDMLRPLEHRAAKAAADQVCQSVEYFLQDEMGIFGGTLIFPPLLMVRSTLPSWEGDTRRQGAWINEMVQRISRRGNRMAVRVE